MMRKKPWRMIITCLSVIYLTACHENVAESPSKDEESHRVDKADETSKTVLQSVIPQEFTLNTVSITDGEDQVELKYINDEWQTTGLDNPHSPSISHFIDELYQLKGVPVEADQSFTDELVILLENDTDSQRLKLGRNQKATYVMVNDQQYQIDQLPLSLQPFDKVFLEKPLEWQLNPLQTITINDDDEQFKLNQETSLNEVENRPFVSGWYIHGDYETPFSVQYAWMERLLTNLYTLRGYPTQEALDETVRVLTLDDGESSEILTIGQELDKEFTVIHLSQLEQNYLVPTQLIELFEVDLLSVADNFVAIIPLDAVQSVDIVTKNEEINLSVQQSADSEANGDKQFYMNEKEIAEDIFRRTYQYLARLTYSEKLTENELDQLNQLNQETIDVTIHYKYLLDGEVEEKVIELISIEGSSEYIVKNEDIIEFKMEADRLNEMVEAYLSLY